MWKALDDYDVMRIVVSARGLQTSSDRIDVSIACSALSGSARLSGEIRTSIRESRGDLALAKSLSGAGVVSLNVVRKGVVQPEPRLEECGQAYRRFC